MKPLEGKYKSSPTQLANLKRRLPKTGVARNASFSVRLSESARDILKNQMEQNGVSMADFLELLARRFERNEITVDDILG